MTPESTGQLPLDIGLDVEARFDTFYAGPNGAAVAALAAPAAPGVWLSGARGSGRSHLLQATVASQPAGHALYLPLRMGLPATAVDGLPADAIICLDDIETIAGDADWERALLVLYERVLAQGGRLIISAPARPADAGFALADLESRLSALSLFRLQPPDDAGQLEALKMRAEARGLRLPDETARYLALRLPRGLAVLFEWLQLLDARSLAANRRLTVPFVRDVLRAEGV